MAERRGTAGRRWLAGLSALALAASLGVAAAAGEVVTQAQPANAASASQFNPEMIIADSLFYDASAMTAAGIQSFLNAEIGTCANGQCLNVAVIPYPGRARELSSTGSGKVVCAAIPAGTYTAAQLIYATQVACGISAEVILVTLQKEQGLVTSRAPSDSALSHAMGMACPDTAPCNSAFAGLGTQIVTGTRQMKAYWINNFARQPGTYFIGYSPNSSCGGTNLNIRNYATAALYNYTPYQPNAAAMANLNGTGDSCSSYGNRNFWRYYTDWFGSTQGQQFITTTDGADYLLAMDSSYELWAYPANGGKTWRPRVSLGAGWNGIVSLIGAGDFDGNGHRDLIALDNQGRAWFYPGNGDLQYLVRHQLNVDWSGMKQVVYAGDFNNDKIPDVFTVDAAGELKLWPGTGAGTFGAPIDIGGGWDKAGTIAGLGDLNGDGCPDLVSRPASGQLILNRGDCAHGFIGTRVIGTGFGSATDFMSLGDFDSDGVRDVFTRDASNVLALYLGTSSGALRSTGQFDYGWSFVMLTGPGDAPGTTGKGVPDTTVDPPPVAPGPSTADPGVGDVNADGNRDILGVSADGSLRAYYGDGAGHIASDKVIDATWGNPGLQFPMGDFTGDGRTDLGIITSTGSFLIAKGKAGGFDKPTLLAPGWTGMATVVSALDWDGDGHVDVMALTKTGQLWLYRGNGTGGWASPNGTLLASGWTGYQPIPVGNFDGNGVEDILALQSNGALWLYRGNGAGGWASPNGALVGTGWSSFVSVFSPGNFDGNPGTDLLARAADGRLYLYAGTGSGALKSSVQIDSGWQTFKAIL